jgi:hypothetical protein
MSISRIESSNREEFVMIKSRMAFHVFLRLQQSQTSDNRLRYARCCLCGEPWETAIFYCVKIVFADIKLSKNMFLQWLVLLPFKQ